MCVNSVCLTSSNRAGVCVSSLGRTNGARAPNVSCSQSQVSSRLGTGSTNDLHSAETIHYFQTCYWGLRL